MKPDTAHDIIEAIDTHVKNDDALERLRRQMFVGAINYARIRTDWFMASIEERVEMDSRRRLAHNAFIDACNVLSRAMHKQGKPISWRQTLGEDRKQIGDFACHLHCVLGIMAR